jgi:NADH dehydrogenase FAD-containing subunit
MARVVVLGAGLGGVACAYEMKKKLAKVRVGSVAPVYEKYLLSTLGIESLKS